ncbi:hypothetical protein C7S14_1658 [Burkholderia cepacia]|nr:hypothetical protein C7S14_1658 [Burkholderia cepacia]
MGNKKSGQSQDRPLERTLLSKIRRAEGAPTRRTQIVDEAKWAENQSSLILRPRRTPWRPGCCVDRCARTALRHPRFVRSTGRRDWGPRRTVGDVNFTRSSRTSTTRSKGSGDFIRPASSSARTAFATDGRFGPVSVRIRHPTTHDRFTALNGRAPPPTWMTGGRS